MKIGVIGAGPAGVSAAYRLAKGGAEVDLYEASGDVGGLARSITLWNQRVDLGPHRFFSSDPRVNELWLELAGRDYAMVDRLTRIFYKNRFFHYPLKPFNAFLNLGPVASVICVLSYLRQKIQPTPEDGTFENWVVGRFGRELFTIFFKTYSEKLWGISCKELDAEFAAQRIKKLSLWEALKNAFFGGKGNKHKTLVDQFAYPLEGTGMIYERMAEFVRKNKGKVLLNTPVQRVITEGGRATAIELENGEVHRYDHIVSSMPITLLVNRLPEVPDAIRQAASKLRFRNTVLVYVKVEASGLFPDNWLYVHSANLQMGRMTNFRNWVPQLYNDEKATILVLEYWCYDEDAFWSKSDAELIELARRETRITGLVGKAEITEGHVHRIHRCYPVYDHGYKDRLKPVEDYLGAIPGLSVIGRYGAFKYNNQDHSILMGIFAAENILDNAGHNLWEINTDYEYQESSRITKTGLTRD